ncbi:hypothetical protein AVEN_268650-1 [Araneus ventricosus]|uniref:Uncharacterized protein n=1 Tax=Araneus ventricosus TaxID=182803 RepID=A0A4Y2WSL1_ARAVE|nr:hypothetical protein AVEN_268650-1 [Araneus ventricosus]
MENDNRWKYLDAFQLPYWIGKIAVQTPLYLEKQIAEDIFISEKKLQVLAAFQIVFFARISSSGRENITFYPKTILERRVNAFIISQAFSVLERAYFVKET